MGLRLTATCLVQASDLGGEVRVVDMALEQADKQRLNRVRNLRAPRGGGARLFLSRP